MLAGMRNTDALLAVLADPKLYQEKMIELRNLIQQNDRVLNEIGERQARADRDLEQAKTIIDNERARTEALDQREARLLAREKSVESREENLKQDEARVTHMQQDLEAKIADIMQQRDLREKAMDRIVEKERDLDAKIADVENQKAILQKKRDQALAILS